MTSAFRLPLGSRVNQVDAVDKGESRNAFCGLDTVNGPHTPSMKLLRRRGLIEVQQEEPQPGPHSP